jgi:thioesterase domain-containing protein
VQEAAVIVHAGDAGGERLVEYVSARAGGGLPTAERMRRYLRERLPEYMVPSAFVLLPSLPHTPTGKVDRRTLPDPPAERATTSRPFVAPRTPLEEYLAGIWREMLDVREIGVLDHFFELGGNSIQAALLVNRLQEKLGRPVYIVAVFDAPTISGIVRYLTELCAERIVELFGAESLSVTEAALDEGVVGLASSTHPTDSVASSLLVCLQEKGTEAPCFLVHPPGGIVVCYQPLAHRLGTERPVYGIRSRGLHGETDLPQRLEDMAAEYIMAIRSVRPEGPYHLGGWSAGGVIAYEMAQQLRAQGEVVGLLALLDTTIPVNAANSPYAEDADLSAREYGLNVTLEELDRMGPEEQLPYLWDHVRKLGLVEDDTPLPLVQQILDDLKRLFHAHITLVNDYVVRPYPGRLTLFRPSDSPIAHATPPDRNWGKLAAGVDVHFVPGLHHTMVKDPHVRVIADLLRTCFDVPTA